MADLKFTKATDEVHEIKLDSHLIRAVWIPSAAYIGRMTAFEIQTVFVGNDAKVKVTGKTEGGKKLGKVKGKMFNNVFSGEFEIPDKVEINDKAYFEVELSDNGLSGESNRIPAKPVPVIKSIKWSADEARRNDILTLSAELDKVENNYPAKLIIYEYDNDGAHDRITELEATIKDKKIEVKWEYEYHEDTDELPTSEEIERYGGSYNPPEYFFTIKIGDFELGKKDQDSGLLRFKDWMLLSLVDDDGNPMPDVEYEITLPDGEKKTGNLDSEGKARIEGIPPGVCTVEYKGVSETVDVKSITATEQNTETSEQAQDEDKLMSETAKSEKKADESNADENADHDDDESDEKSSTQSPSDATSADDFEGEVEN